MIRTKTAAWKPCFRTSWLRPEIKFGRYLFKNGCGLYAPSRLGGLPARRPPSKMADLGGQVERRRFGPPELRTGRVMTGGPFSFLFGVCARQDNSNFSGGAGPRRRRRFYVRHYWRV